MILTTTPIMIMITLLIKTHTIPSGRIPIRIHIMFISKKFKAFISLIIYFNFLIAINILFIRPKNIWFTLCASLLYINSILLIRIINTPTRIITPVHTPPV